MHKSNNKRFHVFFNFKYMYNIFEVVKLKKSDVSLFIMGLFYAIIGIIFLTVPADSIIKFIFIILGVILIVFNSFVLFDSIPKIKIDKRYITVLILAIIQIAMGIFVIVTESKVLLIITGAILLLFPLLEILSSKDKKEQFKLEITKISLGIIFIIIGATDTAKYIFTAIGIVSLIFGIIYLVMALLISIIKDEIDNEDNNIYK